MPRNSPFLSRFFSEPLYGILPAAIASVVGGMLVSHYSQLSVAAPIAAVGTPAGAEMMQMVHDEHAIIISYLQKYTEVRQQAGLAAEQEMLKSKAAEHAAILAERGTKVVETRALAVVVQVAEKPGRKVAAKRPTHELDTMVVGEPLQLIAVASFAPQIQPVVQPTAPPVKLVALAARYGQNVIKTKFHDVTVTMERIPLWVHSVSEWFSDDVALHRELKLPTGIS